MNRRLTLAFLALLGATTLLAEPSPSPNMTVPMVSDYDLDSASYIYCSTADAQGNIWTRGNGVTDKITTSGSSTTVTAVDSTTYPFFRVAAGDEIEINFDGVMTRRYVTAKASSTSITVSAAIDLSIGHQGTAGYGFYFRTLSCSTSATAGWVPMRGLMNVTWGVAVDQMDATSIDATLYCRHNGSVSTAGVVWTKNYTAASTTGTDFITLSAAGGLKYDACRLGLKVNTDDGADTTTHAEKITITVAG